MATWRPGSSRKAGASASEPVLRAAFLRGRRRSAPSLRFISGRHRHALPRRHIVEHREHAEPCRPQAQYPPGRGTLRHLRQARARRRPHCLSPMPGHPQRGRPAPEAAPVPPATVHQLRQRGSGARAPALQTLRRAAQPTRTGQQTRPPRRTRLARALYPLRRTPPGCGALRVPTLSRRTEAVSPQARRAARRSRALQGLRPESRRPRQGPLPALPQRHQGQPGRFGRPQSGRRHLRPLQAGAPAAPVRATAPPAANGGGYPRGTTCAAGPPNAAPGASARAAARSPPCRITTTAKAAATIAASRRSHASGATPPRGRRRGCACAAANGPPRAARWNAGHAGIPDRLSGCAAQMGAVRARLASEGALMALRGLVAGQLRTLPAPLGFQPHGLGLGGRKPVFQHSMGPDPPPAAS